MIKNDLVYRGNYQFVYSGEVPPGYRNITGETLQAQHNGQNKQIKVNRMRVLPKQNQVIFDFTVVENPIPLVIVGYTLLFGGALGVTGWALTEANDFIDKALPIITIGGLFYMYTQLKG